MEEPEANSGEEPTPKKATKKTTKKVKDELLVKNAIEINPKLEEAPNKAVVLGWGRMNPITVGHEKLVNKIKSVARQESATPLIYISHSQDAKKNPLDYDDKIMLAKKAFGNKLIVKSNARTIIQIMQELQKKFSRVILVVGQDRIKQFDDLLNKYNGKDYTFDNISIVSAGDRDPDSEGVDGMSASKMRVAASQGDFKKFKTGLPRRLQSDAQDVYDMVRGGMKIAEMLELDEALTIQQRRMRAITMRKFKSKIAQGRRRMAKKAATMDKLKSRARKAAIKIIRKKVAGKKGEKYATLSPSEKMLIDKRVAKKKSAIDRIAKKLLPQVRKADLAKLSGKKSVNEEFESFLFNEEFAQLFEEPTTGQDPDIKDKRGTQPAVYYKGLAKSTKDKRDAHFKKHGKKDDDDNSAYKPAPGDADSETKTSKHTKRYHQMFNKEGQIKLDRRFRAFRSRKEEVELDEISINTDAEKRLKKQHKDERSNLSKEHEREMDGLLTRELRKKITQVNKEEFQSEKDLIAFIEETTNDVFDQVELDEAKGNEGLKKKAEKSGMPLGILRQVYNRGIAAWKTGHRPGTTPQQWGFARVNSFITKSSGTWGKADADLAAKVRKEEENDPAIEKQKDGSYSYKRQVIKEEIDVLFEGFMANKVKSVSINKKMYDHALKTLKDVLTRKQKEAKAKKTGMRHSSEYYAAQIARTYKDVDGKVLHKMLGEEHIFEAGGAGDRGTDKLTKRYKKDTPGESVSESIDELFEAQFKVEVEGLPDMFIDAKSAGDVKATLRKKLKKPDDVQSIERVTPDKIKKHFRMVVRGDQDPTSINEDVTQKQLSDLEKFADRLLDKFGVDVEFTRHFADRMNDDRNKPKITIPELQRFFKKVAKNKAKDIKQLGDSEAVLKDIQADLNLPVVINYDKNKEEFEVVNKTIMRKKDFKTPDKVVKY